MAKTIKVSFDYEGKHYDMRVQVKLDKHSDIGYALTKRKYNNDWQLVNYNECNGFFAAWNGDDDCPYTFELELDWRDASVLHLRVWQRYGSGVLLDDEGGVENYEVVEHGWI